MKPLVLSLLFFGLVAQAFTQQSDTLVSMDGRQVTLTPVGIRKGTNVPGFITRVEEVSTFYKAFIIVGVLYYRSI
ncbi:MAG: hypothetical protein RLZZ64_348, partial [Bacteroidota bacterium]